MAPMKNRSRIYKNFKDAEPDMRNTLPKILYKYRDWSNKFHQTALSVPEVYFSHPKNLNDPYDIRMPLILDYGEIDNPKFYSKIEESVKYIHPELSVGSLDFKIACSNLFDVIKRSSILV